MNPLEEYPHLFANGKFDALAEPKGYDDEQVLIIGVRFLRDNPKCWNIKGYNYEFKNECYYSVRECTLIARPIEDMTDEEFERLSFVNKCIGRQFFMNLLRSRTENDNLRFDDARVLISIGVYPFDQQHFEDGIVIDSRTL